MGKLILRWVLFGAVMWGVWHGGELALVYRLALLTRECTSDADEAILENTAADEVTRMRVTAKVTVCVANKQNFMDRLVFDMRKHFDAPEKWPFPIEEYQRQIKK